jgi:transposase-like protein
VVTPLICEAWKVSVEVQDECHECQTALSYSRLRHTTHVVRNGTLKGRQRYHCKGCGAWFGQTHGGTPMYRLRTPPQEEVGRALLLVVMRPGSLRAAQEITTGHNYETIGRWLSRLAAEHAEALTEVLVHDLELSALEVDEFWSFVRTRSATSRRGTRRDGASAGAW